ncbi:hypothetical protein TCE0_011f00644 [Talaromyces pinophilus]|uniref:Carboxylesterase type B domain-containing protein n=1 Tax=Talaromyces pinophilus TaxID=128442 RepID=A0A0B8N0J6_TALPI|nr:hypothetical protein TCE0_011f00644 [Talaromyces pinophilus]
MYDGDNLYNGRPLFRAAIMNSRSVIPLERVDGDKAQSVFDMVVGAAGCSTAADNEKLSCLRDLDYETYFNVTNSVPGFLSYSSSSLSDQPRPDGKTLTASPDIFANEVKYAAVPVIIGTLQGEGTFFSLFQANITTESDLSTYLNDIIYRDATREEITALIDAYPYNNGSSGSPYGTGTLNEQYPQFKRLAAILGDLESILSRRFFLATLPSSVPAWSFLATWDHGTPILRSFYTPDLPPIFYGTDAPSLAIQDRCISFITSMDPNNGIEYAPAGSKAY